jgi:hypothetical protein
MFNDDLPPMKMSRSKLDAHRDYILKLNERKLSCAAIAMYLGEKRKITTSREAVRRLLLKLQPLAEATR